MSFQRSGSIRKRFLSRRKRFAQVILAFFAFAFGLDACAQATNVTINFNLPAGVMGTPYSGTISATGGHSPYKFVIIDGKLPYGLFLNSGTGVVSGRPGVVQTRYFKVQATDAYGKQAIKRGSITIASAPTSSSSISVSISPTSTTVASGNAQQFSATIQGTSNTAVTWSASSGTVSSAGLFTAPVVTSNTSVTVTATSSADTTKKASAAVSVTAPAPTNTSTLAITTTSLPGTQAGTSYSYPLSASGGSTPYVWGIASGSLPTGISLSSSGVLSGTTAQTGQFSFTATVRDTLSHTANQALSLSVAAPPTTTNAGGGGNYDGPAELPRTYMQSSLAYTPAPGGTTLVSAGGNLQTALNNANCGDTIQLAAGATFNGVFTLPAKACDDQHWIIVRTSAPDSSLPPEGTRMTPCYSGVSSLPGRPSFNCTTPSQALAKVIYNQVAGSGPFKLAAGANHYRLLGLEIARAAGTGFIGPLISTSSGTADHIVVDRVWLHGSPQDDTSTAFNLNGTTYVAVIDSYINDFHCESVTGSCTDAHAVSGGTSTTVDGIYQIDRNFLEAAAESVLFGGGYATTTPTDIEVRQNHFFKPLTWMPGQPGFVGGPSGNPFMVKNHLELKNAQRVLIEGNIFENTWGGFSQNGYSILLTPKNQAGANGTNICPICEVTDVTIRYSTLSHAGAGISMANVPSDNGGIATAGERYSVHDITLDDINANFYKGNGTLFQVFSQWPTASLNTISINHITGFPDAGGKIMSLGNFSGLPPMYAFNMTNSIIGQALYPIWTTGGTTNCAIYNLPLTSLNACFTSYGFNHNAIIATSTVNYPASQWPTGNYFPSTVGAVGFANFNNGNGGNYSLLSTSPYKNVGSDGKDLGADINAIQSLISGVY